MDGIVAALVVGEKGLCPRLHLHLLLELFLVYYCKLHIPNKGPPSKVKVEVRKQFGEAVFLSLLD
jgi:hypothetical protein